MTIAFMPDVVAFIDEDEIVGTFFSVCLSSKLTKQAIAVRLSGMLAFTSVYNITNVRSTFSIPAAFNRRASIFNLSRGELGGSANMFGRLILANLQAAAFKRDREVFAEIVPEKIPVALIFEVLPGAYQVSIPIVIHQPEQFLHRAVG